MQDPLRRTAEQIARAAHEGQVDKAGVPYIEHPRRVVEWVERLSPGAPAEATATAWLHDVLEDTDTTAADLRDHRIPGVVVTAVEALSKRPGEPVEAYFARIRENDIALVVKRADLADNTDPERLALLPPAMRTRLEAKYHRAFTQLQIPPVHVLVG